MNKNEILYFLIASFCCSVCYGQGDITVTSLADDNSTGTLRWAMKTANTDSNINKIIFDSRLRGSITLTTDLPYVTSNLVIKGIGAGNITISGDGLYRMFVINSGFILDISGFTFTNSANDYNNGTIFAVSGSTVNASEIVVTGIDSNTAFWSKGSNSIINISNSTFNKNSATLFRSLWGSTPSTTSDNESDYDNRITVTGSTFSSNRSVIFSTERYVKIDNCIFTDNANQIASFRGVNRYQVLNSTFTNNTGYLLFTFSSGIGDTPSWGADTLGANNTLFDGNNFFGNTGTIVNTGGGFKYDAKTTITNNTFVNNGNSWYGSPVELSGNLFTNFTSVTDSSDPNTIVVTMDKSDLIQIEDPVY